MATVKISPNFKIVIPKEGIESIGLKVGDVLQVFQYGSRIELVPVKSIKSMKGFLNGKTK